MNLITGLNHITFAVKDINISFDFYVKILGMTPHAKWSKGAYLTLGDLWFCLNIDDVIPSKDYTHISFTTSQEGFENIKKVLLKYKVKEWQKNKSEGSSIYILDPDGHKLEIHIGNLKSRLKSMKNENFQNLEFFR